MKERNKITAFMAALYKTWVCGQAPVQTIELSLCLGTHSFVEK